MRKLSFMLGKSFLGRMLWNHPIHVNKPHPCFVNMPNELICFLGGLSAVKPCFFTGTLEACGGRCCVVNPRVYTHCYKISDEGEMLPHKVHPLCPELQNSMVCSSHIRKPGLWKEERAVPFRRLDMDLWERRREAC